MISARGDDTPLCCLGIAQVMHRMDGTLPAAQKQHEGESDQRHAPGSTMSGNQGTHEWDARDDSENGMSWP
jgi:hypothetical protein